MSKDNSVLRSALLNEWVVLVLSVGFVFGIFGFGYQKVFKLAEKNEINPRQYFEISQSVSNNAYCEGVVEAAKLAVADDIMTLKEAREVTRLLNKCNPEYDKEVVFSSLRDSSIKKIRSVKVSTLKI